MLLSLQALSLSLPRPPHNSGGCMEVPQRPPIRLNRGRRNCSFSAFFYAQRCSPYLPLSLPPSLPACLSLLSPWRCDWLVSDVGTAKPYLCHCLECVCLCVTYARMLILWLEYVCVCPHSAARLYIYTASQLGPSIVIIGAVTKFVYYKFASHVHVHVF